MVAAAREAVDQPTARPLAVIDLALPHDVEPGVSELPGVSVLGLAELAESLAGSDASRVRDAFGRVAAAFQMSWQVHDAATPTRTLLLVSRFGHCLNDLLFRASTGALNVEIPAVVSNHPDAGALVRSYGHPFHHVPVTPETKPDAEKRLLDLVEETGSHLVVLARYMQVLSDDLCRQLSGRAINIHHSFLPSFKGARPYHQAFDRGVKLVGATAHYVTADLDEGPIIEQDVLRVDHGHDQDQLVAAGRDVEAQAMTGDDLVPERDDLRQVVAGVDVQQRQRQRRGGERLECDVQQHCGVLAAAEQQRRAFELGDDLADDLDGLGLECPQRRQLAGGVRGDVRWRHRLGHAGVLSSSMRRRISARDSSIERPWVSRRNSGSVGTS